METASHIQLLRLPSGQTLRGVFGPIDGLSQRRRRCCSRSADLWYKSAAGPKKYIRFTPLNTGFAAVTKRHVSLPLSKCWLNERRKKTTQTRLLKAFGARPNVSQRRA